MMAELTYEAFQGLLAKYEHGGLSDNERKLLAPYKVKRAILLASGLGSRLMPVTKDTPKPLIRVGEKRIIDSILEALLASDITEIYIVVGYLGEQFEQLKEEYPSITLLRNPDFETTNNISSATVACEHFENAYVFESDLLIKNPHILPPYQFESNYLGVAVDETPDWCFDVDADCTIEDLHKGGTDCYHMYGVSYWSASDGKKLAQDLPKAFEREDYQQRFWDDVPCVLYKDQYRIKIRPCSFDDIAEIDTIDELRALDASYA